MPPPLDSAAVPPPADEPDGMMADARSGEAETEFENIRPPPAAIQAATNLVQLIDSIPEGASDEIIDRFVERHRWSAFNVPIFWAAAADDGDLELVGWIRSLVELFMEEFPTFQEMATGDLVGGNF